MSRICPLSRFLYFNLGFLTLGAFASNMVSGAGFNIAMEATDMKTLCRGCHARGAYAWLTRTVHFSNRTDLRAICLDRHPPHQWTNKIARKMQAPKEMQRKIFGTISRRQKFLDGRLELGNHG